jgi:hypothetical protein
MKTDKEKNLLKANSYAILAHYLNNKELMQGQNISNPFLPQKQNTPSFNIYCDLKSHEWRYKDFATDDKGDCIDLVMKLFNIPFQKALVKIKSDLGFKFNGQQEKLDFANSAKPNDNYTVKRREFNQEELDYWNQYGITVDTLNKYNVTALEEYTSTSKDGNPYTFKSGSSKFVFAYECDSGMKLYKPHDSKQYRFQHLGTKDKQYIFGWEQLPDQGDNVFLTGGEKDVMSLHQHGFNSFTLNSETASLSPEIVMELKQRFKNFVVLYDNDETGINQSTRISDKHGIEKLILPPIDNGKDISDYFASGGTSESLNELLSATLIKSTSEIQDSVKIETKDWDIIFNKCIDLTAKNEVYQEGNQKNFTQSLASHCNHAGIPAHITESLVLQNYNLTPTIAKPIITNVYEKNKKDFAKFASIARSPHEHTLSKDERLMNMPFLPDHIYQNLPEILIEGCKVLDDRREKDVFITGALPILSGCIHNVMGIYRGKEMYSNLYVFIVAPSASGKGALSYSKQLGDKYHDSLKAESRKRMKLYKQELAEYKRTVLTHKKENDSIEPPIKPDFKLFFIPANSSSARVIQHLMEGDGQGVFCETEASTMINTLKQDWGSYLDLLLKGYHHETVTYSRKTLDEYIEINKPRLSVALTGVLNQVEKLIKSAEDGLHSRFIFYTFKSDVAWINIVPEENEINLTTHFDQLSETVFDFVSFLEQCPEIEFELTKEQWKKLNDYGAECINTLATFVSEDLSSTSKRLGLILFRICMIITALRYFENGEVSSKFICSDKDFDMALEMVKVYQEHAVFMFSTLPKSTSLTDRVMKVFFESLPPSFTRKEAILIAENDFSIKQRTADLYLKKLVDNKWLDKAKTGFYYKIK